MIPSALTAGIGTGALLGLLMGLSTSPTVATVIGALVAMLGAILGFKDTEPADSVSKANVARQYGVGAFGIACILGAIAGITLRTGDVLASSPRENVDRWMEAGYDSATAKDITAYRLTGIVPRGATITAPVQTAKDVILFSAGQEECEQMSPTDLADADNIAVSYRSAGGRWKKLADALDGIAPDERKKAFIAAWRVACEE